MKTEITKDTPLTKDDIVEFHFKWLSDNVYFRALQLSAFMTKLENAHKDFELKSHSSAGDELILTYRVKASKSDMVYYTASISPAMVITSVVVIGGGLLAWLTAGKIYKITQSPAGQVLTAGVGVAIPVAALAVLAYFLLKMGVFKK